MPQIVFLSLFLGLITGTQTVTLQAGAAVKSVRIELGGREVARIDNAPWSAKVDFGNAITPGELIAIAYDGEGNEIARTSQLINLSRPPAEMEIVIRSEGTKPVEAELVGRHRLHVVPTIAKLSVDGVAVPVGRDFRVRLPEIDASHPHIISAEMQFEDDQIAKRDVVMQAGFSDSAGAELTPLLVTAGAKSQPQNLEGCFSAAGAPLRATAIETNDAYVVMVKDPGARIQPNGVWPLDFGTAERVLWPVTRPINASGQPTAISFPQSVYHGTMPTVSWLLAQRLSPAPPPSEPRQFADAVAVAAMSTLERGRRRAVVLLLSKNADRSLYTPPVVRRYLEETGVPLFVWSSERLLSDAGAWGQVDDISTSSGLEAAVARLNRALSQQRVVWLAADPLTALNAEGAERCGLIPMAHRRQSKPSP